MGCVASITSQLQFNSYCAPACLMYIPWTDEAMKHQPHGEVSGWWRWPVVQPGWVTLQQQVTYWLQGHSSIKMFPGNKPFLWHNSNNSAEATLWHHCPTSCPGDSQLLRLWWRKFSWVREHNKLQRVQSCHRRLMGWKVWDPETEETSWPPPTRNANHLPSGNNL